MAPASTLLRAVANQRRGKELEVTLAAEGARQGLVVIPNGQKVRWLPGGRVVTEHCQLDFTLLAGGGRAAFVDAKTVAGGTMAFSAFNPRQLALALQYQQQGFAAGFCVYFRGCEQVAFFLGTEVQAAGRGRSVAPSAHSVLGTYPRFDLTRIFTWPWRECPQPRS